MSIINNFFNHYSNPSTLFPRLLSRILEERRKLDKGFSVRELSEKMNTYFEPKTLIYQSDVSRWISNKPRSLPDFGQLLVLCDILFDTDFTKSDELIVSYLHYIINQTLRSKIDFANFGYNNLDIPTLVKNHHITSKVRFDTVPFGTTLYRLRIKKFNLQQDFAKATGFPEASISRWESNQRLPDSYKEIDRIISLLDCTQEEAKRLETQYTYSLISKAVSYKDKSQFASVYWADSQRKVCIVQLPPDITERTYEKAFEKLAKLAENGKREQQFGVIYDVTRTERIAADVDWLDSMRRQVKVKDPVSHVMKFHMVLNLPKALKLAFKEVVEAVGTNWQDISEEEGEIDDILFKQIELQNPSTHHFLQRFPERLSNEATQVY